MQMCVCVRVSIYICICIYTYTYLPTYIHTCCVYTYVCIIHVFSCLFICIPTSTVMLICLCVCAYVYVYIMAPTYNKQLAYTWVLLPIIPTAQIGKTSARLRETLAGGPRWRLRLEKS